ncbi:TonB-dependent receptor plug domain-containing protein [Hellea balneolensis]|uniref:TonB-dependent receptor plug domain-containing protein n=1 Tax=Hellea balneolensis TaxID=287478 RepID=UPI0003F6F764|nr:TonB-dependent receptor plug domain-containing protein [Hellea balneolensis]
MRHYIVSFTAIAASLVPMGIANAADMIIEATYEPAYFEQFQPVTAQDMVAFVPGFSLQGGGGGDRGFGQASLNLLINGRRPSSKSSDAGDILGRIPASSVKRIDIVDGTSLDIPGLTGQVANIITASSEISGRWRYDARFADGSDPQILEGEVSITGTRGNLEFVAGVNAGQFTFDEIGTEQFFDGNRTVFEERQEDVFFTQERPGASINLTYTPDNGHVANVNLSTALRNRRMGARETFQAILPQGTSGASFADNGEDEIEYEIGGDYSFPVGKGTLKLIGLHSFEDSDFNSSFVYLPEGADEYRSKFNRFDKEGEYIARGEYSWKSGSSQDWQLSWEGAFNYLDSETEFADSLTPLTFDNVHVEEKRTEANLTHSVTLTPKINLQTSLGAEYSELDVTTNDDPARSFLRPKGFISASFDANENYTWRAKIERDVSQLNFGTFVSSVDLTESTANTGNSRIVPTQFWNGELEVERKGGGALSGNASIYARYIEDPIDRVLFADGSEGPGNLKSAFRYGIEGNMTVVFDSLGAKGLRLELEGGLEDSSIDDPVTGQSRKINDTTVWNYEIGLTHDIPNSNWAWGFEVEQFKQSTFFRLDQSFEARFRKPFNIARITHKDVFGMRVDVFFQNFLGYEIERERLIFDGDRTGDLIGGEFFSRKRGKRMGLRISDTF